MGRSTTAVPLGEDPPPASSWQRYLAATGWGRDADAARRLVLPTADPKRLLGGWSHAAQRDRAPTQGKTMLAGMRPALNHA